MRSPQALERSGSMAEGATAYVTLEPCSHTGETPPCAELLKAAKIARVVTPIPDPYSRVAGRGHRLLHEAGISVETGCLAQEAIRSHLGFLLAAVHRRPMVTLKLAHSLDGKAATPSGESKWISGTASRRLVHALRASHDGVMIGKRTALADDPRLTSRSIGPVPSPIRIVLDSKLSLPTESNLGRTAREHPVWLCHCAEATDARRRSWQAVGARTIECRTGPDGRPALACLMEQLAKYGLTRVLCEGGPTLAASLIGGGLADRIISFASGKVLGGESLPMIGQLGGPAIADAPKFALDSMSQTGGDAMCSWSRPIESYGF